MPQLMPMGWMVSSLVMLVFLLVMILVFGVGQMMIYSFMTSYKLQPNFIWCW